MNSEFDAFIEETKKNILIEIARKMFLDGIDLKKVARCYPSLNEDELIEIQNEVLNPA